MSRCHASTRQAPGSTRIRGLVALSRDRLTQVVVLGVQDLDRSADGDLATVRHVQLPDPPDVPPGDVPLDLDRPDPSTGGPGPEHRVRREARPAQLPVGLY